MPSFSYAPVSVHKRLNKARPQDYLASQERFYKQMLDNVLLMARRASTTEPHFKQLNFLSSTIYPAQNQTTLKSLQPCGGKQANTLITRAKERFDHPHTEYAAKTVPEEGAAETENNDQFSQQRRRTSCVTTPNLHFLS